MVHLRVIRVASAHQDGFLFGFNDRRTRTPPARVLVQLAQALDVSADELLGLDKAKSKKTPKQDPETKRLWKKFRQLIVLPEKDRRTVIRLLNSLGTNSKIRNSAA